MHVWLTTILTHTLVFSVIRLLVLTQTLVVDEMENATKLVLIQITHIVICALTDYVCVELSMLRMDVVTVDHI